MTSKRALKPSAASPRSSSALAAAAALSAAALVFVFNQGWTLYFGDAEAHLNIARRLADSRLAGYHQIGTVWLPVPHLLMAPFVLSDALWFNGLGGALPAAAAFTLSVWLLFLTARRLFQSTPAAWTAAAVYSLNPNLLYLQATPMTEAFALCALIALAYFCARFNDTGSLRDAALAGLVATLGALTRYEAWILIPAAALFFLLKGRWPAALTFSAIAALGPLYWIAHNWILYSDPFEFYRGEWSAKAIYQRSLNSGAPRYPGDHDLPKAWLVYRTAVSLALGKPLVWLASIGALAALYRRAFTALALFALVPAFYLLSMYSSGTPIFVPTLWPHSWYNSRYAINALPLAALAVAALDTLVPDKIRPYLATLLVAVAISGWLAYPRAEGWICWKESQVNSASRRALARAAADYLQPRYRPGAGIFMGFGDHTAILRLARIPIRESLHQGDLTLWEASAARPDLFLWQEWVIAATGDPVSQSVNRLYRGPRRYERVRTFTAPGSAPLEIWRHIQ